MLGFVACRRSWRKVGLFIVVGLVCFSEQIAAKQNKGTPSPTDFPTVEPSASPAPSKEPTDSPTQHPSHTPTYRPSSVPTPEPTTVPTDVPTGTPTTTPTEGPTVVPTIIHSTNPTPSGTLEPTPSGTLEPSPTPTTPEPTTSEPTTPGPTNNPSNEPVVNEPTVSTASPTDEPIDETTVIPSPPPTLSPSDQSDNGDGDNVTITGTALPSIGIAMVLSDADAASTARSELDIQLTSFFENVLATNSGVDTFLNTILTYDFVESDVRRRHRRRRRLETALSVTVLGTAFFAGDSPTEGELSQSLTTYFSIWGIADLEDYLHISNLPSAEVTSISIDGEEVQRVSGGNEPGQAERSPDPFQPKVDDPSVSTGAVVGLATGCLVLLIALAVLVVQGRRMATARSRKRRDETQNEVESGRIGAEPFPQPTTPTSGVNRTRQQTTQDEFGSDGVSIDHSLYTTDESLLGQGPYDANRLDKVIQTAKQNTLL